MGDTTRLHELTKGYQHSAILLTAVRVGLFEVLGSSGRTARVAAETLGLNERALEVVMLALAADGVLEAHDDGRFSLAPEYAPYLLAASPQTQINIMNHDYGLMQRWVRLAEVLRSGKPVEQPAERTGEDLRYFICGMADISRLSSLEVADRFDFSPYRRLLDVGGGPGTHAITFARRFPNLHCDVFDLEGAIGIAHEEIAKSGLEGRVGTRVGNFLEDELGEGYDLLYVSNIIHMLGSEQTLALAEKCRRALVAGGTLIIKEFFLDEDRIHPPQAALFSVNMLVNTEQGKSYTLGETKELLTRAGFERFETMDLSMANRMLIAR